jgi:hypothetical protein
MDKTTPPPIKTIIQPLSQTNTSMKANRIIRQIQILFWAIFGSLLAMLITILFMVHTFGAILDWPLSQREMLKSVILILSLGGIPASYFFHTKKVKHIPCELALADKLKQFRSSFFIKIATLEALGFLALLSYLVTADFTFIYVFALLFIAYFINVPSKRSIINELEPDETN